MLATATVESHRTSPTAVPQGPAGASLLPYAATIPAELRARDRWINWRYGALQPNGKRQKIPVSAIPRLNDKGKWVYSGDDWQKPAAWAPFSLAMELARRKGWGVGYVFAEDDPYVGIDFDDCLLAGEIINPEIKAWVDLLGSYTERSVSHTGLHVIVKGSIPKALARKDAGIEIYSSGRWFAFTGAQWGPQSEIVEGNFALDALYQAYTRDATQNALKTPATSTQNALPRDSVGLPVDSGTAERAQEALGALAAWRCDEYNAWIRVGMSLTELGDVGLALWDTWSQNCPQKYLVGDCAQRWGHLDTPTERAQQGLGAIALGNLFLWAAEDSNGGWTAAKWFAQHSTKQAPAAEHCEVPLERWPWQTTEIACPFCKPMHHHARPGNDLWDFVLVRHFCHQATCPDWQREKARRIMERVAEWGAIYVGVVTDAQWDPDKGRWRGGQWRKVLAAAHKGDCVPLRIPQPDGTCLAVADAPLPLLQPVADRRQALLDIYEAIGKCPPGRRVEFGIREPRAGGERPGGADNAEEFACARARCGSEGGTDFTSLERHERAQVLQQEMGTQREPDADKALQRQLAISVPPQYTQALRDLWAAVGLQVSGDRARGTREQAETLANRVRELRRRIAQGGAAGVGELMHVASPPPLSVYASIHQDARQVNVLTGEIAFSAAQERPLEPARASRQASPG